MGQVKEHYSARAIGVNATMKCGVTIAAFLCATAGNLTINDADGSVLVANIPVTAGVFTRIPLLTNTSAGCTLILSGGASGTLFT